MKLRQYLRFALAEILRPWPVFPPFEEVPLRFLCASRRQIVAECPHCRRHHRLYLPALMERHGPMATLMDVNPITPCWFCHRLGTRLYEIPRRR
jgi:hypothetical protein